METINGTKNPLIKEVKKNDLVIIEIPSMERASYKQIVRITECNYVPKDQEFDFDWLEFEAEVLYCNFRMHKSMGVIGNCLSIMEILPEKFVDKYVRIYEMWPKDQNQLSDAEFERKQLIHI